MNSDAIDRIIRQVDEDEDGTIDFDEFTAMMFRTAEDAIEEESMHTESMRRELKSMPELFAAAIQPPRQELVTDDNTNIPGTVDTIGTPSEPLTSNTDDNKLDKAEAIRRGPPHIPERERPTKRMPGAMRVSRCLNEIFKRTLMPGTNRRNSKHEVKASPP